MTRARTYADMFKFVKFMYRIPIGPSLLYMVYINFILS